MGRTITLYTGGRVLMFTLVYGLLLIALPDLDGLFVIALAVLLSSVLSLFVLRTLRDRLTLQLAERQQARLEDRQRLREQRGDDPA